MTAFHSRFTSLSVSRPSGERASPRHLRERNRTSTAPKLSKTSSVHVPHPWRMHHFEGTDRSFAMCAVFPHSDYYALFDCLSGLGVSSGSPHAYSPPSFTSLGRLSRVYHAGLQQDGVGGVLLAVPSTLCGSPALCRVRQVDLHRSYVHESCGVHRPLFSTIGVLISVGWLTS